MTNQHYRENINKFLSEIEPYKAGFSYARVSYVAMHADDSLYLVQGRLFLDSTPLERTPTNYKNKRIVAGHYTLNDLKSSYDDFLSEIFENKKVKTPFGYLDIPLETETNISTSFQPFHREGIISGKKISTLYISGGSLHRFVPSTELDWELKSSATPYDTLDELLLEFQLPSRHQSDHISFETIAFPITQIDMRSEVIGNRAKPSILLSKTLDKLKCQIGYRAMLNGKVELRGSIKGEDLKWGETHTALVGTGAIDIPTGAVIQCFASYAGDAQHQYWIGDPNIYQNPRRTAVECFDNKLEILRDYLFEEGKTRGQARDFEHGVAGLIWMLGCAPYQTGATKRAANAPDIVFQTPSNHLIVLECTTGLLKAESKLQKLVERSEGLRRKIEASGYRTLKILSMIATSKTREEVKGDLDLASQMNVSVLTQETLAELLEQSMFPFNADMWFEKQWEEAHSSLNTSGLL